MQMSAGRPIPLQVGVVPRDWMDVQAKHVEGLVSDGRSGRTGAEAKAIILEHRPTHH
mgnify:CR=1 FL=1